jgi:hypothetical protein
MVFRAQLRGQLRLVRGRKTVKLAELKGSAGNKSIGWRPDSGQNVLNRFRETAGIAARFRIETKMA